MDQVIKKEQNVAHDVYIVTYYEHHCQKDRVNRALTLSEIGPTLPKFPFFRLSIRSRQKVHFHNLR